MNDTQLHSLYEFLSKRFDAVDAKFDAIDARFDANDLRFDAIDARFDANDVRFDTINARFDENDLKQNEILNAIGADNTTRDTTLRKHSKRITALERRPATA